MYICKLKTIKFFKHLARKNITYLQKLHFKKLHIFRYLGDYLREFAEFIANKTEHSFIISNDCRNTTLRKDILKILNSQRVKLKTQY